TSVSEREPKVMSTAAADRCRVPQAFWHVVERIGVPPAALLRQARLPATLHLGGPGQVNTAQFFALWQALEQLAPGPGLGISLVQAADTAVHPPSSLPAFHARDYRDGLARIARFKRLCTPEALHMVESGKECTLTVEWLYATEPAPDVTSAVAFAALVELGRRRTGHPITPLRDEMPPRDP